jgi:glyoxylase I family protein
MDQGSVPPSIAKFDHFGISVTDLIRSLDFYCHVLGAVVLVPPHLDDKFNFRRAVVMLVGPMGLDLNEHATNSGEPFDPVRTGLDHLAFGASSYEVLVAWAKHLETKGVPHSPIRNLVGFGETFDFRDPDGIQIEFWHKDQGGAWANNIRQKLAGARSDVQRSAENT